VRLAGRDVEDVARFEISELKIRAEVVSRTTLQDDIDAGALVLVGTTHEALRHADAVDVQTARDALSGKIEGVQNRQSNRADTLAGGVGERNDVQLSIADARHDLPPFAQYRTLTGSGEFDRIGQSFPVLPGATRVRGSFPRVRLLPAEAPLAGSPLSNRSTVLKTGTAAWVLLEENDSLKTTGTGKFTVLFCSAKGNLVRIVLGSNAINAR
jgi:hypothetical protein